MNVDLQVPVISENQSATEGNGKAQESQQENYAVPAAAVDSDAEGDIDMGDNVDEIEPKAVENQQPSVAALPDSIPPASASMTSGFSRFHVTIDPRNASSSTSLDPTTSTAKLVTLDDPLAFRAYRPKTTPSAIGRILARNPGLSVDAFTEVLQAESATVGFSPPRLPFLFLFLFFNFLKEMILDRCDPASKTSERDFYYETYHNSNYPNVSALCV